METHYGPILFIGSIFLLAFLLVLWDERDKQKDREIRDNKQAEYSQQEAATRNNPIKVDWKHVGQEFSVAEVNEKAVLLSQRIPVIMRFDFDNHPIIRDASLYAQKREWVAKDDLLANVTPGAKIRFIQKDKTIYLHAA